MENTTRILAVDDSVTIRKALELILVPAGYAVEFAVNGAEAIEKATQLRPDILLLDFILPDMRGTEVCRDLLANADTRSIPVVLISARGAEIRQAYHDIDNVVDYLTKPFTPDAVLGVLHEVLASQRARVQAAVDAAAPADAPSIAPAAGVEAPLAVAPSLPSVEATAIDDDEEADAIAPPPAAAPRPRDVLESMFETLRAGLEGVYVEEMDTPAGAAADEARSYTELASRLARQLGETLEQAESRQRFRLYGDGSIRSLDESLLDTYRRVCRLLFRAVTSGAVGGPAPGRPRPRLLIICPRESESYEPLAGLARESGAADVFLVSSDYRQMPALVRLFAPTHLVVDAGRSAAVWDQLRLVRALPEARRMQTLAVRRSGPDSTVPADAEVAAVLEAAPGLQDEIRRRLGFDDASRRAASPLASPIALASGM